ncbi:MAG: tyrosine-type recombinase/integrase [Ignavibacteria bacterium]|nr:tyrosine-type recombinase/integrase [Ignavibacteria bacterium]
MEKLLNKLSVEEIEKLKWLFSMSNNQQPKEVVTLRVFVDEYCDLIKRNRSHAYYVSVVYAFKHLVEFYGSQKPIQLIGLREVEDFTSFLQQKVKNGFVVYFRNLKAAFNKAKEWEYVKENYFVKVKLPKRQKLAPIFINSDQLLVICDCIKSEVVKDVVVFAFYTGMRLDEIVNLRWKNIDLQNGVITVGDEEFTTKGRNQRFIPITEEANGALLRVKSKERRVQSKNIYNLSLTTAKDFVFCKGAGRKFTGDYFSRRFKRACRNAGMGKSIHFHSLRHSFASNLVQKGVSLYAIKELLGHSSITTTEIYAHLNMDTLREAVEKLDTSAVRQSSPHALLSAGSRYEGQGVKDEVKEHNKTIKNEVKIYRINSGEMK